MLLVITLYKIFFRNYVCSVCHVLAAVQTCAKHYRFTLMFTFKAIIGQRL